MTYDVCAICRRPIFRCINSSPPPNNCKVDYHHSNTSKESNSLHSAVLWLGDPMDHWVARMKYLVLQGFGREA